MSLLPLSIEGRSVKTRILITGVAGFIGSNLAQRLIEMADYEVIGIDNLMAGIREQVPEEVEFHELDVRSKEIYPFFQQVDYVYHLAAKNCLSDCQLDPVETAEINIAGTVNVFEAAKRAKVRKIIYAESSAIYEGSAIFPTPESETKPESFYAISKWATGQFAEAYRRFFQVKYTALRYFNVYGPRQDYRRSIPPVMSAFIIKLLRNEQPVIYGTGHKQRDFVYVGDVNDFHLLCLKDHRTDGKIFNVGSGVTHSILETYELISELLGRKKEAIFKPDLPGEAQKTLADITEAKKLRWAPKVNMRTGLKKMIDYIEHEMSQGRVSV